MTLIVENGEGIHGAESYVSVIDANNYWTNRPHHELSVDWLGADDPNREGALREATQVLDGICRAYAKGEARVADQGLLYPITQINGETRLDIAVPQGLLYSSCELAARALKGPLIPDRTSDKVVSSETLKVTGFSETFTYDIKQTLDILDRFPFLRSALAHVISPTPDYGWVR